jgi:hypothetical protein
VACKRCAKDPTRRANYRCQRCGAPVCEACTFNTRFCSEKCNKKYQTFFGRFGGTIRRRTGMPEPIEEAQGNGAAWVIALVLIAAITAGTIYAHHAKLVVLPPPVGPAVDKLLKAAGR